MATFLSYTAAAADKKKFKKAGTYAGEQFNLTDVPTRKYFKLFFYFNNGNVEGLTNGPGSSGGLLSPTWDDKSIKDTKDKKIGAVYYQYNSAWTYLKLNNEEERAESLKDFVNLLSNISSNSPWYFTEVAGLDSALDRRQTMDTNFSIPEERKKITIKCLADPLDDRIGTLLDLYRSIVWSWINKREVLPSNLRKFDMGIMIFNESIKYPNFDNYKMWENINDDKTDADKTAKIDHKSSYKYIEFHNCEIDYNSAKTPYASLNNIDGVTPEYSIDINFDDCYESRFNEFMMKQFGDMVLWDYSLNNEYSSSDVEKDQSTNLQYMILPARAWENFLHKASKYGYDMAAGFVKKAVLGNLYTTSLTEVVDQIQAAASGSPYGAVKNLINTAKDLLPQDKHTPDLGNLYEKDPKPLNKYVYDLGNLYSDETLRNNI